MYTARQPPAYRAGAKGTLPYGAAPYGRIVRPNAPDIQVSGAFCVAVFGIRARFLRYPAVILSIENGEARKAAPFVRHTVLQAALKAPPKGGAVDIRILPAVCRQEACSNWLLYSSA